ncbi:MAG TPA: SEC-C metal-binding domain-containing protein [Phycisphaerae bacterium]|nr:SEC-C metal-binding domain-containing protein [Phycisphaerae bacterium]
MQAEDGHLELLDQSEWEHLLAKGGRNFVRVGDVFRIRECFFEIENLDHDGIVAKGISRVAYRAGCARKSLDAMQDALARTHEELAKGRRRNEPCPCGSGKKYKHCCGAGG